MRAIVSLYYCCCEAFQILEEEQRPPFGNGSQAAVRGEEKRRPAIKSIMAGPLQEESTRHAAPFAQEPATTIKPQHLPHKHIA